MNKLGKLNIALVFIICMLCVIFCGSALADEADDAADLRETPVYIDGLLSLRGYLVGDATYLPFDAVCIVLGYQSENIEATDDNTVKLKAADIEITINKEKRFLSAKDRYFFLPDGYVEHDGVLCLSIDIVAKLFTLNAEWDDVLGAYDLGTDTKAPLVSADEFYNEEDLYWMSRIITYEAGNQPIEGQIGVGNVVLNRVESEVFPDTVKEVIFQPGQFSPVESKAIFLDPFKIGVITAKMAFEGCSTVGDALYFHRGIYSEKHTVQNKNFVTKIGDHNFFISIENLNYV